MNIWSALDKSIDYIDANKEKLAVAVGLIFGGYKTADKMSRNWARYKRAKEDRFHREREIYDRSSGMYLQLKRPMTSSESIEFSERKRRGQIPAQILKDMGLLRGSRR